MLKVSYLSATWNYTSLKPLLMLKLLLESAKKKTPKQSLPQNLSSYFLQHPIGASH